MNKVRLTVNAIAVVLFTLAVSSMAQAQATRTWVSGVGDDANPCSRTAPCKTFAGAISKTATGGEISVLDPGGYGAVTITKAITIDGGTGAGWASILASGTNGVIVNAANTSRIILRNLSINGTNQTASAGLNGIRFLAGKSLIVDNCNIFGFGTHGIDVNMNANQAEIIVRNTNITGCSGAGIKSTTLLTPINVVLDNVFIEKCTQGVFAANGSRVTMSNSKVTMCSIGVLTEAVGNNSEVDVISSVISLCTTAGIQAGNGAGQTTVTRIANTIITRNNTGISIAGGTVSSTGNNFIFNNTTNGAPNGPGIGPA